MVETRSMRQKRIEEEEQLTLNRMPDVVMEQILKHCDYFSIDALHKTCKDTRAMVEKINPDPRVSRLWTVWGPDYIEMDLSFRSSGYPYVIYKNQNGGCLVSKERNLPGVYFENSSAAELARHNLEILLPMLTRQKNPLDTWSMVFKDGGFSVFQATMAQLLVKLKTQIPTATVWLDNYELPDISLVLSFVCPATLTRVVISDENREFKTLDLSRVAEMEQWKSLCKLSLTGYLLDDPLHVGQFPRIWLHCNTIEPSTVAALKEMFRNSPSFVGCLILIDRSIYKDRRLRGPILRAISETESRDREWYFSMPTPGYVLKVEAFPNITFTRAPLSDLKNGDVVLD